MATPFNMSLTGWMIPTTSSSGYPEIQSFKLPVARVGYFDTRRTIGVVTEIVGATKEGHEFRRNLKAGSF